MEDPLQVFSKRSASPGSTLGEAEVDLERRLRSTSAGTFSWGGPKTPENNNDKGSPPKEKAVVLESTWTKNSIFGGENAAMSSSKSGFSCTPPMLGAGQSRPRFRTSSRTTGRSVDVSTRVSARGSSRSRGRRESSRASSERRENRVGDRDKGWSCFHVTHVVEARPTNVTRPTTDTSKKQGRQM